MTAGIRERKKLETRGAIHDAALRLVAENGIEHASVDAICSEAGVSSRTFFNYFPSKIAALVGVEGLVIGAEAREAFLAGDGDHGLIPDLCVLVASFAQLPTSAEHRRDTVRELLARRPELVRDMFLLIADARHQVAELVAQRTTEDRARLATALVFAAVGCAMDSPLDHTTDDLGEWLLATVEGMSGLVRDSVD